MNSWPALCFCVQGALVNNTPAIITHSGKRNVSMASATLRVVVEETGEERGRELRFHLRRLLSLRLLYTLLVGRTPRSKLKGQKCSQSLPSSNMLRVSNRGRVGSDLHLAFQVKVINTLLTLWGMVTPRISLLVIFCVSIWSQTSRGFAAALPSMLGTKTSGGNQIHAQT